MRVRLIDFTFLLIFCSASVTSSAQENNVLTRFGIGELRSGASAGLRGWGSLSSAFSDPNKINSENPASLSFLNVTSFEFGAFGNYLNLNTATAYGNFGYAAPEYLQIAVPLKKNVAGLALGLQSFSRCNYDIRQLNDTIAENVPSFNTYTGSGGAYKVFLASGFKAGCFSLGLKANYVFGTVKNTNMLFFSDSINGYYARKQESRYFGDVLLEGGIQYRTALGKKYHFSFGINGNLNTNLATHHDLIFERVLYSVNGTLTANDTVYSEVGTEGNIVIPMQLNSGFIITKDNHWSLGAQFNYGAWKNYSSFGSTDSTINRWKISVGSEIIPDKFSYESYFSRVAYRFGANYGVNYIMLRGNPITEAGVTVGLGFPIRGKTKDAELVADMGLRHLSNELNLSFEVGKSGSIAQNGLSQFYVRGTFSFAFNDFWFVKRRYE